ncbi:DUF4199 domain-containing protein [Mesonia sp.]|uniref:DUF4199 domain-containing protein n=1 Tax=Mesonia sp. TaxID=1960830 RepID=UPI00176B497F|nr:DUF4199 domain-containing protein [Mesonia sp.]HIB37132.1 DUF4199 domain-containing protein [Mesonia sp.]HIO26426.1 DUF4199 domain-containing protein [Flavobacteriaceae bacterium]
MEKSASIKSIAYTYGLALAIYSILVLVVIYVLNIDQESSINYIFTALNIVVTIIIYSIALKTYKKENSGFISLSQALKTGMAVAVIAGLISAVYAFIHYSYIYPEFLDMISEQQRAAMIENGQMSDEQIEQSLEMMSFTRSPFFMSTATLIMNVFFGFIISLIIGLIIKKKDPSLVS